MDAFPPRLCQPLHLQPHQRYHLQPHLLGQKHHLMGSRDKDENDLTSPTNVVQNTPFFYTLQWSILLYSIKQAPKAGRTWLFFVAIAVAAAYVSD